MSRNGNPPRRPIRIARWSELPDREPQYALVSGVDLVLTRFDGQVSLLYGRCQHRGALLADGHVRGEDLICGLHDWDYRLDSGISAYDNSEALPKFVVWVDSEADAVYADEAEIEAWQAEHPQPYDREAYLGLYEDPTGTADEPHNRYIRQLARDLAHLTGVAYAGVGPV